MGSLRMGSCLRVSVAVINFSSQLQPIMRESGQSFKAELRQRPRRTMLTDLDLFPGLVGPAVLHSSEPQWAAGRGGTRGTFPHQSSSKIKTWPRSNMMFAFLFLFFLS